ncbi:hypothetical protein C2845_PM14G08120 [Panicum miliaceum]|uniref:non-specific serine/threonine protein kinase n=1 Tax=Panicum miliaceum TaxID=4540 RepID=A0A3L6PRB7_PANMI|nr:hypothetical protein C2845_PM14G08120 [Panicum miliaceum]
MAAASSCWFSVMSISLFSLLLIQAPAATSLSFSFNFSSSGDPCDAELRCERDTHIGPGILELTKNEIRGDPFSVGRASYARPVPLWDNATGEIASFVTNFTFQIKPKAEDFFLRCNVSGDGMAFFLANYPSRIPPNSYGWNLALFNDTNNLNATGTDRVIAVEFDTSLNNQWDRTINHVGIDVNSIGSKAYVNVTKGLVSEDAIMTAKISYNNVTGILAARLQIDDGEPYAVSAKVDMKGNLPEEVAVGFSAATGSCIELHQVLSWSFSSTLEATSSKTTNGGRRRLLLLLCAAVGCLTHRRRIWMKLKGITEGDSDAEHEQAEFERGLGPRRYLYHELVTATSNFAEEEKLGRGGFGNVYRGSLSDQDRPVPIKMFSAESSAQGRKAFEAEVKIISRLRHRNLVQLLGWCDSPKDTRLSLAWALRCATCTRSGISASCTATSSPSNILLDSSHSTKLGDFGLARLVDHGAGPRTTKVVMGTAGYIDPEFIRRRRPSTESDIYSFGVVLLEIVTGRRPVMEHQDNVLPLPEWIWDLYERNVLLEAVDQRLTRGRVDGGCKWQLQRVLVVMLWCAHPDPGARPSIVKAINVLQSEDVTLPVLSRVYRTTSDFSRGSRCNISGDDGSWALSGGR